ncbi:sensor histidine kinase family protein [Stieleria varia]|nr:ATPase [Stieleria varia]
MATWINPQSCRSLAVLVETVTAPMLIAHKAPVCLEMDIPTGIPVPTNPEQTAELLRVLTAQALAEMPDGGDLTFTGCETSQGIELEVADTGCRIEEREKRLPMVAAAIDAKLLWQNCPQGGAAVTICLPRASGQRRMAA